MQIVPTRDPADETRFTFYMPMYDVTVRASFMALPGDVNCDGRITSADAALLLRASIDLVR